MIFFCSVLIGFYFTVVYFNYCVRKVARKKAPYKVPPMPEFPSSFASECEIARKALEVQLKSENGRDQVLTGRPKKTAYLTKDGRYYEK